LGARKTAVESTALLPGKIQSWLDEKTLRMFAEWASASTKLERKRLCRKWRLASRLHASYFGEPS